ncbi:hypothetical protein GCM10011367_25340 [Marinicauda pacifica]|nr:hypothetical protein GCM10011367_25340 [Marinicauda pacifica]
MLGSDKSRFKHCEAGSHPHHEESADQKEQRIENVTHIRRDRGMSRRCADAQSTQRDEAG